MAEDMQGYPHETLSPVPSDYECPICQMLLCEPLQIAKCGHRFCKNCLKPVLSKVPPQCPLDRQEIEVEKVFTDQACHRAILSLDVKCLNSVRGCSWTGELLHAEEHQDKCQHEKVTCSNTNCDEVVERKDVQTHSQRECIWRMVPCIHCEERYALCYEIEHTKACPMIPIACTNNCDTKCIPRREMTDHIKHHCTLAVIECTYSESGCNIKMKRMELQKHLNLSVQSHLSLTYKRLTAFEQQNKDLKEEIDSRCIEMAEVVERLDELERQPTKYDGKFLWRIGKYEQNLANAKAGGKTAELYSDQFYSGRYGYKFKCCVSLNGDGDAKGSYLSVYLIIMRGKFDALLPWPYSNKIVFTLMDQRHNRKERSNIVMDIIPDVTLEGYRKPESERNPGVGIWKFAKHENIVNGGFLRNDEIFLKCEVEPFDILQKESD